MTRVGSHTRDGHEVKSYTRAGPEGPSGASRAFHATLVAVSRSVEWYESKRVPRSLAWKKHVMRQKLQKRLNPWKRTQMYAKFRLTWLEKGLRSRMNRRVATSVRALRKK